MDYRTTYSLFKDNGTEHWECRGRFDSFEEAMRFSIMQEAGRWRIDICEPKALYSTP